MFSNIKIDSTESQNTFNHIKWKGWNYRFLSKYKILITNHVIENIRPECIVLWETWLNKKSTTIDTRYDIHWTIDADHQGVMILTKKNLAVKHI